MKKAIFAIMALLLMADTASACLSPTQIVTLVGIEHHLNLTNNELIDMFNSVCNSTYSKAELDSRFTNYNEVFDSKVDLVDEKINGIDFSGVDEYVQNKLQNYTTYWEEKAKVNDMLLAIYNNTIQEIPEINDSDYMKMNDKSRIDNDLDDLREDIVNLRNSNSYTGSTLSRQDDNTWIFGVIIVVVLVIVLLLTNNGIRRKVLGSFGTGNNPGYPQAFAHDQISQSHYMPNPKPVDEDTEVSKARKNRTKELLIKAKRKSLESDLETARRITDRAKREAEFERIERELDELSDKSEEDN